MSKLECAPTGRITYKQLREIISLMDDEQLNMDVTIEDEYIDECFAGELAICGEEHSSLDNFHPVIRILNIKDTYA